eukprot:Polyplicarium_translucidae@DN3276_c0_g1_i2.p1
MKWVMAIQAIGFAMASTVRRRIDCYASDVDSRGECGSNVDVPTLELCGERLNPCYTRERLFEVGPMDDNVLLGNCGDCGLIHWETGESVYTRIGGWTNIPVSFASEFDLPAGKYRSLLGFPAWSGEGTACPSRPWFEVDFEKVDCPELMTCWNIDDQWDPSHVCPSLPGGDHDSPCGTLSNPCHVTKGYPEVVPHERLHDDCGKCITIHRNGAEFLHAVIVGGAYTKEWSYSTSQWAYQSLGGQGRCQQWERTVGIIVEDRECTTTTEVTCYPEGTSNWDSASECSHCGVEVPGSDAPCGDTADNPCLVTRTYEQWGVADGPPKDGRVCGTCLEITFEQPGEVWPSQPPQIWPRPPPLVPAPDGGETKSGFVDPVTIHAKVIGAEAVRPFSWSWRVNRDTFAAMGGDPLFCGKPLATVRAEVKEVSCP